MIQSGSGIATKRADFDYDLNGRVTFLQRSTNTAGTTLAADSTYDYDELGRLTRLVHRHGAGSTNYFQIAAYAMGYDAANRIVRIDSSVDEASLYAYDRAGQLTAAEHTFEADEAYSYDANGNRTNAGYTTTTNNRLSTDGVFNYTYDDEGNRTSRTEIATGRKEVYVWDHRNRLSEVWFYQDATTIVRKIRYAYDPFDRRVSREDDDTPSFTYTDAEKAWFLYDGADVALDYHDDDISGGAAAALAARYLQGPAVDQIMAQENVGTGDVLWQLTDHLGSTRDLVESDGDVAAHYQYDSFGQLVDGLEDATRYLYTGREWEPATDYNYHRARWLDPATGKWLSEDPIGFAAGDANLTRYVGNGAVGATDPTGLIQFWNIVDGVRGVVERGATFVTGAADSFTMDATRIVREGMWGAENSQIQYTGYYKAGEYTEIAVEIGVTGGTAVLKKAAGKKIAQEAAKIAAKAAGEEITEAAAQRAMVAAKKKIANDLRRHARKIADATKDEVVHHRNTLLGHPPGAGHAAVESAFPTIGFEWLANHRWNLMKIVKNDPGRHIRLHDRALMAERLVVWATQPLLTATRTLLNLSRDFRMDIKVDIQCKD